MSSTTHVSKLVVNKGGEVIRNKHVKRKILHAVLQYMSIVKRSKIPHLDKKEITTIDPWLKKPTENIEKNIADGIDEMVPDPSDVPGGFNQDFTARPDLFEADAQAFFEKHESIIISLKSKSQKK